MVVFLLLMRGTTGSNVEAHLVQVPTSLRSGVHVFNSDLDWLVGWLAGVDSFSKDLSFISIRV